MEEEIQMIIEDAQERMNTPIEHLVSELLKVRAGKANPSMLEGIKVDYYGNIVPLNQTANINTPDARTIIVQPWEKSMIGPIEKAILAANIGINPVNDGNVVRLSIPPLTEERRKNYVKQVRNEGENSKVIIRNIRRENNEELKKLKKDGVSEDVIKASEEKIQKITDNFIKKVDDLVTVKEKDIMTI